MRRLFLKQRRADPGQDPIRGGRCPEHGLRRRDDIGKQVATLKGLTAATVTKDGVTQSLAAIKKDLRDIAGAQSALSSDRRSEVEAANTAFTDSLQGVAGEVRSSLSTSGAKAAVVTALQQLGASYEKTFAPLSCS